MRYSRAFIPTTREDPAEAEVVSHRLMLRAGMIRKVAAGIYNLLPLGFRAMKKVEGIVREEMDRAGAQEVLMPFVVPAELWKESGRWDVYGKELLRIKDRHDRDFCLGPTHEEVVTDMVRREVRSYRQLPLNIYQIQIKFRDEIRPRFGLMRGREFIMKDAYSFHVDEADAEREYRNMFDTYSRIFERCGLGFRAVEAETGAIGGSFSHEFMVLADTGEDQIVSCSSCGYAANLERAECRQTGYAIKQGNERQLPLKKVSTPQIRTVEEVSAFLKVTPERLIKTIVCETDRGEVVALIRGDHELNEAKLKRFLGCEWVILAEEDTVKRVTGAPVGFAGPVGLKARIIADHAIAGIVNGVTGANKEDFHFVNVNPDRDFKVETYADLRMASEDDGCPRCDEGRLSLFRGIEVGHVFKLGTKYSKAMGANFLNEKGEELPMIMGCYGIGIGRTVAAAIEQNHDDKGIIWPLPIAPYQVYILPVNIKDAHISEVAGMLYKGFSDCGIETIIDDRDERAGVKFNDADITGIPLRITVGSRVKEGKVELKRRDSQEVELIDIDGVVEVVKERVKKGV